jgi:hypothetical protein
VEGREVRPRSRACLCGRNNASSRTHVRVLADASVLPQVTSKRTLQCVQVTDAPAAIVQLTVRLSVRYRPFVRYRPRDNPAGH